MAKKESTGVESYSEADFAAMQQDTAALLAAQPKRTIRVPYRDGIKQRFVMVWVNGYPFQIMRGVDVDVPQTVYDQLVVAGEI